MPTFPRRRDGIPYELPEFLKWASQTEVFPTLDEWTAWDGPHYAPEDEPRQEKLATYLIEGWGAINTHMAQWQAKALVDLWPTAPLDYLKLAADRLNIVLAFNADPHDTRVEHTAIALTIWDIIQA